MSIMSYSGLVENWLALLYFCSRSAYPSLENSAKDKGTLKSSLESFKEKREFAGDISTIACNMRYRLLFQKPAPTSKNNSFIIQSVGYLMALRISLTTLSMPSSEDTATRSARIGEKDATCSLVTPCQIGRMTLSKLRSLATRPSSSF